MIYKTRIRILNIDQQEPHKKTGRWWPGSV